MYELTTTISLIGMPGVGKSYLGRQLASSLQLNLIDLDVCIENQTGMSIPLLWSKFGEMNFRCLERFFLMKALTQKPLILSCGGGTPCFFDNMNCIRSFSYSIYLKSEIPAITEQMLNGNHPIFKSTLDPQSEWNAILDKRRSKYESAHQILKSYSHEPNLFDAVSSFCLDKKILIKRN